MSRTKTAKFIVFDFLQWAAYASPVFVTGTITAYTRSSRYSSEYWLIVSLIIGYVAAATLLIWVPVKLAFQWMTLFKFQKGKWCPGMALFMILSAIPCTVMLIVDTRTKPSTDLHAHCIELLVVMLVITDLTEKLKRFKLRASFDPDTSGMLTDIAETTGAEYEGSESNYSVRRLSESALVARMGQSERKSMFAWRDPRPWILMRCVLNAYDIRLVMELAHDKVTPGVSTTNWIYAIYIIALCGMCTFILKPKCRYSSLVTVTFLEIPFFFLRFAYLCHYGHVISILFFLKNLLSAGTFLYFNVVRVLFVTPEASFGPITSITTVDRSMPNGTLGVRNPNYPTRVSKNGSAYASNHVDLGYNTTEQFNYQTYHLDENAPADQYQQPQEQHEQENDDHEFDPPDHQQYDHHEQYDYGEDDRYQEDGYYNWKKKSPHRDTVLRSDLYATPEHDFHHQDYETHYESDGGAGHVDQTPDVTSHDEAQTTSNVEASYSSVNLKTKAESRKKRAPAAPVPQRKPDPVPDQTESTSKSTSTQHSLPDNHPGMMEINLGPQRVSVRKDLSYTPAVAAQIAKEAYSAVAKDAVAELDNVVESLDFDNSSSASSYNVRL